jgi:hypothetical protein
LYHSFSVLPISFFERVRSLKRNPQSKAGTIDQLSKRPLLPDGIIAEVSLAAGTAVRSDSRQIVEDREATLK